MNNLDYLKEINETEKKAEEIIAGARILREENEKKARLEAENIIEQAVKSGEAMYKEAVEEARLKGEKLLSEAEKNALEEADVMSKNACSNLDMAIKNVTEGIVDICVNR